MSIDLKIEDFIGKYPNIENTSDQSFMNPYPDFYNSIYSKNEFYSLRLDKTENRPERGGRYKHQEIIARFLSSHTMYDRMLLLHEMGTGKSCSAFAAIEEIKNTSSAFKGALVLSRGPRIISNLMHELAYVCTLSKYAPDENDRRLTDNERIRRLKKLLASFYTFNTFDKFTKDLRTMTDNMIINTFSNMIIVIDEVHNLRIHGKPEESRMYHQIHRMLHLPKNTKVIIMSGTPMKDDVTEIAPILNLILPQQQQLPTGHDFVKEYFNVSGSGISKISLLKDAKKADFKKLLKGRVSYLKSMTSDIKTVYSGEFVGKLHHLRVVPNRMSKFQSDVYRLAYTKDVGDNSDLTKAMVDADVASGIYSHSRQASLFVFPNSQYGSAGFKSSFTKRADGKLVSNPDFLKLKGATNEITIANIEKHSIVYANIIKSILANPKKLHFIYNSFVHGSGAIVLGKLLNMVGFSASDGTVPTSGRRYAVLTNATNTQSRVEHIIKQFNQKTNMNGDYIQVIIGSKILAEGITLMNVQEIHIVTPHWNYSEIAQAIARGVRLESHRNLLEDGQKPVVTVYQHVALPDYDQSKSIDLQMYELSESKDVSIKSVERMIKEAAFDCALFYNRNAPSVNAVDKSRECDYQACDYSCDGVNLKAPVNIDYSTYNIYYKKDSRITQKIVDMFSKNSSYTLEQIVVELENEFDKFDIIFALRKLIVENEKLKSPIGFDCYLRERHNIYFLVDRMVVGSDFFSSVYVDNPISKPQTLSFSDASDAVYSELITTSEDEDMITYAFDRLSSYKRRVLIQTMLELKLQNRQSRTMTILLDHIEPTIMKNGLAFKHNNQLYCFDELTHEWSVCEEEKAPAPKPDFPEEKNDAEFPQKLDKFGYIGQVNITTPSIFCIKKNADKKSSDTRTKNTGKVCTTWNKYELLKIIKKFKIDYGNKEALGKENPELMVASITERTDFKRSDFTTDGKMDGKLGDRADIERIRYFVDGKNADLCNIIKQFMRDNNILYSSEDCGKMGAKKLV